MYPITRPSLALAASYGATLEEAFSSALKHDEAPAVADARLDQADEQLSQAWGGFLPSITAEGTYGRREDTGRLLDPEQWSARLAARWQLFQGGAEYAGLRSLRRTREGADASVQAARHALYARVAEAHFAALAAALELETLKSLLDLTQQRVKELSDRARIGRTRESEALAARAQLASVSAQVRAAEADLGEARAGWSRVTGLSPEQAPSQPLDKDPIAAAEIPRPFPALAHFMGPARERPDVVAARRQFEAADELWQVALAGNFPKLEATGNWYLARSGSLDNGRWDAVLTLTLPLFEGGAAFSRVREASAASREAELNAMTVARDASQEVRSLYEQARAGVERTGDLEAAARLAEEAYQRVNREFRLGLATNLEVLQTLNSFQETRRALFRTRCETLTDWARLQAASGRIPPLVPRL